MEDSRQNVVSGKDVWQEKAGWERGEPFVRLSLAELNGLLEPVFPGRSVEFAQPLGTGLSNSNYKIRLRGEERPFVLRIYRGDADVMRKEKAVAQLVRFAVPVPAFLHADASFARFPRPWALLEWHDGELLSSLRLTASPEELASAAAALGRTLASVHAFPFPVPGLLGPELEIARRCGWTKRCSSASRSRVCCTVRPAACSVRAGPKRYGSCVSAMPGCWRSSRSIP
ncbi:phosphotransferase family protein [Paenibacillus tyrfis]|uniref:phosphotransferase family protein n=1 Tax=Paenibacillus tyrfis TaxID=1501230 RepID=UPI00068B5930|nr:aminoglycoside phosphotransferase family protein [Paenibacillus tyrfis]